MIKSTQNSGWNNRIYLYTQYLPRYAKIVSFIGKLLDRHRSRWLTVFVDQVLWIWNRAYIITVRFKLIQSFVPYGAPRAATLPGQCTETRHYCGLPKWFNCAYPKFSPINCSISVLILIVVSFILTNLN